MQEEQTAHCSDLLSHVCQDRTVQQLQSPQSVIDNWKPVFTCLLFQAAGQLVAQVVAVVVVVLQLMSDDIKLTPKLKKQNICY